MGARVCGWSPLCVGPLHPCHPHDGSRPPACARARAPWHPWHRGHPQSREKRAVGLHLDPPPSFSVRPSPVSPQEDAEPGRPRSLRANSLFSEDELVEDYYDAPATK